MECSKIYIIWTTTATKKEAKALAKALLEKRLIACAQWRKIHSLYRFNNHIYNEKEYLLTMKTTSIALASLKQTLLRLHSYNTPQYIAMPISDSTMDYEAFVEQAVLNKP